jgi:hypothetical protein
MKPNNNKSKKHQQDIVSAVSRGETYFWDYKDLRNGILYFYRDGDAVRLNDFVKLMLENPGIQNVTELASDKVPVLHDLVPIYCELQNLGSRNDRRNQTQNLCSTLTLFSASKCWLEETFHCLNRLDLPSKLNEKSSLEYFQEPSSYIKAVYALKLYQCYQRSDNSIPEGCSPTLIEKMLQMTKLVSESCTISQVLLLMTIAPIIQKYIHDSFYIDDIKAVKPCDLIGNLHVGEKEAMISLVELLCMHIREHIDFILDMPVPLLVMVSKIHFPLAKSIVDCLIENCTKESNRGKDILLQMCHSDCNINQLCQDLIKMKSGTKQIGSL